jgi:hypothetical protein
LALAAAASAAERSDLAFVSAAVAAS